MVQTSYGCVLTPSSGPGKETSGFFLIPAPDQFPSWGLSVGVSSSYENFHLLLISYIFQDSVPKLGSMLRL